MLYFIFAALVVLLDQLVKYWITLELSSGGQISVIPGVIHLTYVENTGAAYNILSQKTWLLVIISLVAVAGLIYLMVKGKMGAPGRFGLAAVLGGAIGNLIDRLVLGYVVDFFEVEFIRFPVFNVADSFITIGCVVFCVYFLSQSSKAEKQPVKIKTSQPQTEEDESELNTTQVPENYDMEQRLTEDKSDEDKS